MLNRLFRYWLDSDVSTEMHAFVITRFFLVKGQVTTLQLYLTILCFLVSVIRQNDKHEGKEEGHPLYVLSAF